MLTGTCTIQICLISLTTLFHSVGYTSSLHKLDTLRHTLMCICIGMKMQVCILVYGEQVKILG